MARLVRYRFVIFLVVGSLLAGSSVAAPPKANYLFPAGAARGSTAIVTVNGSFGEWPARVWANDPGITAEAEKEKGKFKITVGESVAAGVYWLRFFDQEGASAPRPWIVGTIPEAEEDETNDTADSPQRVSEPLTINGRLARNGDVDCFALDLRAGQTLVAAIEASAELGAPMDCVLQICSLVPNRAATKSGSLEAFVVEQTDDTVGLDPRIAFEVPQNGSYLVRVFSFPKEPNSTIGFAGGENYIYRLTLTTGPFISLVRPAAIQADVATNVRFQGWNVRDDVRRVSLTAPSGVDSIVAHHPEMASYARLAVVGHSVLDYEPTDSNPPTITIPLTITGNLQRPRQRDTFSFEAKKGDKLRLQVASRNLGFAADPVLAVTDAAGKTLTENDDGGGRRSRKLDPEIVFTAPDDGRFQAVVRDIHGQGSDRHLYRLTIEKDVPDFDLTVSGDSFVLPAGKPLEVPLTIDRQDGFAESILFTVEGLPSGITVAPTTSEKEGNSAKSVKLVFNAAADAAAWQGPIKVIGTTAGENPKKRAAIYKLTDFTAERSDVWLAFTPSK